jgi:AraC-like DNA-binding protein
MKTDRITHAPAHGLRVWWMRDAFSMPCPHTHSDIEINVPLQGEGLRYLHAGKIYEVPLGRLAVFWGGIPHQLLSGKKRSEGVWLTLPLPWVLQWDLPENLARRLLAGELVVEKTAQTSTSTASRWVQDFESGETARRRVFLIELEARLHRLGLCHSAATGTSQKNPVSGGESRLVEITSLIAARYCEEVTVEEIASRLSLNPRYMMRLFRRLTGISVWEYVLRLRVAHAQRLLITTNKKIADLAMESGFGSVAPFYAAFKKWGGGGSPVDYRRKVGNSTYASLNEAIAENSPSRPGVRRRFR